MATHSSNLAWRIPGTEEPGGLPSIWSHRVGHSGSSLAAAAAAAETIGTDFPTPYITQVFVQLSLVIALFPKQILYLNL